MIATLALCTLSRELSLDLLDGVAYRVARRAGGLARDQMSSQVPESHAQAGLHTPWGGTAGQL